MVAKKSYLIFIDSNKKTKERIILMQLTEEVMIKNLQRKFSRFNKKLFSDFSKPEQKFIKDCSYGILSSQSCIVRQISQCLHEKIDLKKTQERLTYHLNKPRLNRDIIQRLSTYQCNKLKKDSLILVDPSDIVKAKAMKMEGLSKIRDGNDGKWKNGYDVLDIVGVNKANAALSLFPIHSELYSNNIGLDTLKNKLFDQLVDIIIQSNNRGIFVFDRGFDDKKVIKALHQHDASYIIRMKSNRKLIYQNKWHDIAAIANKLTLNCEISSSQKKTITAGAAEIGVPLNSHRLKHPELASAKLVVAKITSKTKRGKSKPGFFYLLVHLPRHNLSDAELGKFALGSYRLRWKVEEVQRQIKNNFKWEKIQLLNFDRLQTMNTLLWLAISFLYELDTWKIKLDPFPM